MNSRFSKEDTQMTKTHMERYSKSLVAGEIQIKTTTKYCLLFSSMPVIKRQQQVLVRRWRSWRTHTLLAKSQMLQPTWKIVWRTLRILNIKLPYDSAILLLGTNSREMKTCPHKHVYTNIHSSIIHNTQKINTQMSINR